MADKVSGSCLCGAVRFSGEAEVGDAHACHCSMCQKSGGVSISAKCAAPMVFEGEENLSVYRSSEWGERLFCKICGSLLVWRMQDGSMDFVTTGTLDDASGVKLASQIFIDEKPAYYNLAEDTHNMTGAEVMAALVGGDA